MEAKIVFYKQNKLDQNTKYKLRKELLGIKEQKSNFSRYKYQIKGVLDKVKHYRPVNSTIIIKKKDLNKIEEILNKFEVGLEIFDVKIPKGKLTK